jgi:hypothetical protein
MLGQAEDHLTRMFAHLGPVAAGVLLADCASAAETPETGLFSTVRLGQGSLPGPLLGRLLAEFVPAETPVLLLPGAVELQRQLVGL